MVKFLNQRILTASWTWQAPQPGHVLPATRALHSGSKTEQSEAVPHTGTAHSRLQSCLGSARPPSSKGRFSPSWLQLCRWHNELLACPPSCCDKRSRSRHKSSIPNCGATRILTSPMSILGSKSTDNDLPTLLIDGESVHKKTAKSQKGLKKGRRRGTGVVTSLAHSLCSLLTHLTEVKSTGRSTGRRSRPYRGCESKVLACHHQ
ncbi:hypothetical protein B566_EDAN008609 [Ephemera danica]|nr:hypothetical protein B566_EDAN008609 [Ephemera danica]